MRRKLWVDQEKSQTYNSTYPMRIEPDIRPNKHIPNLLSLSRILLGFVFFLLFRKGTTANTAICLGIITLGMITDYLDGTLARRNNLVTMAGKWIDPLSDFTFFFFVYLAFYTVSLMPLVLLILFLLREISMYTVIRPLYVKRQMDPAAKLPGKIKTALQIAGTLIITALTLAYHLEILNFSTLRGTSIPLLSLMVATSLASIYWYVKPLLARADRNPEMKEMRQRLFRLVFYPILALLLLYCLYAYVVTVLYNINLKTYALYVLLNSLYHVLIVLASLAVRSEFRLETSGKILNRINLPLYLSFSRICAVPTLVLLFLSIEKIEALVVLVPLLAFLFLTDLFDGLLARGLEQTTHIGRILDAAGDYVLILAISWVYLIIGFIPIWLFIIVLVRLVVQAIGIITLYILRGYSYLKLSFLGKASVFAVFTIYGIELLEYLQARGIGHPTVVRILEIIAAGIVAVSLLEKVFLLRRSFGKIFGERRDQ
ncbi:MAG: CDP-alcohol phosphatidyltransferase family protein [Spirochaetaceae bacterium]|nr:MAG: CDP-alcohol phosphatidyltransferase family protein [Spirochaetaceae bacterium]